MTSSEISAPGALVSVHADGTVGVNLDELPPSSRDSVTDALSRKPDSFWTDRALRQVLLMSYRLVFRAQFYPDENRQQLPLPPDGARPSRSKARSSA